MANELFSKITRILKTNLALCLWPHRKAPFIFINLFLMAIKDKGVWAGRKEVRTGKEEVWAGREEVRAEREEVWAGGNSGSTSETPARHFSSCNALCTDVSGK